MFNFPIPENEELLYSVIARAGIIVSLREISSTLLF